MIAPARAAAFDRLMRMVESDSHSDELLRSREVDALSVQDRNLATALMMGVLRWQLLLDRRIAELLTRPGTKLTAPVEIALRLGAFQLLFLERIPPHAAIGESVELAKAESRFAAGMVNAVLRKIAAQSRLLPFDAGDAVSAHPKWMVERWVQTYGRAAAEAICLYDQQAQPVSVRLVHDRAEELLAAEGVELAPGALLSSARRVLRGDVSSTSAFRAGMVRIQDEGSQLVAELAGHGQRILDLCAAPGGKTAILAERNPEAEITACDISARRLDSMRRMLDGAPGAERIRTLQADASILPLKPEHDLILCDVPCSGTGTIARNPEIRHRITSTDLQRQQARQAALLSNALTGLAPGGRLIYSTCSLEPEENEQVVERGLAAYPGFCVSPLLHKFAMQGAISADGCLRTIPGVHPCDGFFAAQLVRRG